MLWPPIATVFIYILGAEAVLLTIIWGKWGLASKRFSRYVKQEYPDFYVEHLHAPFWAGGPDVFLRHVRTHRFAMKGQMPDEKSSQYQTSVRRWKRTWQAGFLVFVLTMVSFFLLCYFGFVK